MSLNVNRSHVKPLVLLVTLLFTCIFFSTSAFGFFLMPGIRMYDGKYKPFCGYIAAKGVFRDPETGHPVWVKYNEKGAEVEVIAVADPNTPYGRAEVISANAYVTLYDAYLTVKKDHGDHMEILTATEYAQKIFVDATGQNLNKKPTLDDMTYTVVVRTPEALSTGMNPVLLESFLDLRRKEDIPADAKALLISEDRQVLATAPNNIAFRAAFYANPDGSADPNGADSMDDFNRGDTVVAPMPGVRVTSGLSQGRYTASGEDGWYRGEYYQPPCPGMRMAFNSNLTAEMRFRDFNPKKTRAHGIYLESLLIPEVCDGYQFFSNGPTLEEDLGPVAMSVMKGGGEQYHLNAHVAVDVAVLTGNAVLKNEKRPDIGMDSAILGIDVSEDTPTEYAYAAPTFTPYAPSNFDMNGDGVADTAQLNTDGQVDVWLNGSDTSGSADLTRIADKPADFTDQGLLKSINEADLRNTDLYIYRVSNDQLVTSRKGLKLGDRNPYYGMGTGSDIAGSMINYRFLMRGPASFRIQHGTTMDKWQNSAITNPDLRGREADHLKPGEKVKVILINRATGYIGTGEAEYGVDQDTGMIGFTPGNIVMRPPNLKIKAQRTYKVTNGMNKDKRRNHIISFEGSGLTSDIMVEVTTEWYDWNGTPLPDDLEGYTGRLAKVTGPNLLSTVSAAGGIAQFDIKPGNHIQVIRLPQANISNSHFYIHISGEPLDGNPALGAGQGPLQYRPAKYVPVKVALYDEQATRDAEMAYNNAQNQGVTNLADVKPVYRWVYRPEMQFSVFDLEPNALNVVDETGTSEDVLNLDFPNTDLSNKSIEFLYSLLESEMPALSPFGPGRELIFAVGGQEITATIGADQTISFSDPLDWGAMDPDGLIALRLYQNGDDANVLWEYAFPQLFSMKIDQLALRRDYQTSLFNTGITGFSFLDSFKVLPITVLSKSRITVSMLDEDEKYLGVVVPQAELEPGEYKFLIDHKVVNDYLDDSQRVFLLKIDAAAPDNSNSSKKIIVGVRSQKRDGKILGQIMVHDVLVQDGSLNLSRQDFVFKGRGPALEFSRTYNNSGNQRGRTPLGQGWRHSLDKRIHYTFAPATGNGSVPVWVEQLRGQFFREGDQPTTLNFNYIIVNGTAFKGSGGIWHPERGRHGTLTVRDTDGYYIYTAKDGTRYIYPGPNLLSMFDVSSRGAVTSPLSEVEDRNGNRMTFEYDDQGYVTKVTDAVGRDVNFAYMEALAYGRRLESVTGQDNIQVSFTYDDNGYLTSATRATRTEIYRYEIEEPAMGALYNLVETEDSNGNIHHYTYYGPNDIHWSVFIGPYRGVHSYDLVKSVCYPDTAYPSTICADFTYNFSQNLRTVTDLKGNPTTYALNIWGNPQRIEEPMGKTTIMTWSIEEGKTDNVMTSKSDPRNAAWITYYEHDAKGNITRETDPYGNFILTEWNQTYSLPENRTDRNGEKQEWRYDDNGNLLTYIDGDQILGDRKAHQYTYYPTGERETYTDLNGNTTHYTYDSNGNPETITEPGGASITRFVYDIRGRKEEVRDPESNATGYSYNDLDQLIRITYPPMISYALPAGSSNEETFEYDAEGNLKSETNRLGLTLTYTYTPRDQVETITRSIGGLKTFSYDPNGNLQSETDWKGIPTTHGYDALNRRTGTINRLRDSMSMEYDLAGNLETVTDYQGNPTSYEYDRLNRQFAVHKQLYAQPVTILRTYYNEADPEKNLHTETDPEGNTTTYEYNGRYLRTKRINARLDEYVWAYDDNGNLIRETDEELNYTRYEYDIQNRRTHVYRRSGTGEIRTQHMAYDLAGNPTHVTDARGNTTETRYDEWNRAYEIADADNNVSTYQLDGMGNKVYENDGRSIVRRWTYDPRGLMLTYTDGETPANAFTTVHTYDLNGNPETITHANNALTRMTYDDGDRLLTVTEAEGTTNARTRSIVEYDRMGNPLQQTDFNGNITVTTYNPLYLPERVYDPAPFNANYTETTYYRTGKVKSVRNRLGHLTQYVYDELNRLTTETDALGQDIVTTYDKVGNVKTVTDKRNILTENFYDRMYRLIRTERAGIRLVTNEYDDAGNLTTVIDAENNRTQHTYNNRNLVHVTTFVEGSGGETQVRTYDEVGNLATLTDEEQKVTTYTYDNENRKESVEFAAEITRFDYDLMGNLTKETKPRNNVREFAYDELNRLIRAVDDPTGDNLVTRYEYDDNGNLRHQYDPDNRHVEFTYDSLNRKTAHIQHKTGGNLTTRYTQYDAEGNLKAMTDPMDRPFTYDYDELNRQTHIHYPALPTPYNEIRRVQFGYDENNNLLTVTETKNAPGGMQLTDTTANTYDNFDRLDTTTQRGLLIDYAYDNNGNRTSVTTPSGTTTYTYDHRNRLATATADGGVTTYSYYADGKSDTMAYPNGTDVKYTYTAANRTQSIVNKVTATGTVISSYTYQYDANGNRTQQVEVQGGVSETTAYTYDNADRLLDYTVTGTGTTVTAYTYEGYNRKTETVTENATVTRSRTYTYDDTNWLTRIVDDADPVNPLTIAYTYDNNGNTILKSDSSLTNQDTTFVYDAANRLVETKRGPPGSETLLGQYDYNFAGFRIRHRLSERGDVEYFYDDTAVIEERNMADDTLLALYRYADRLISLDTGAGKQYYHHDALGSTVNLTDETAGVQVSYKLDPWGQIREQVGSSVNRQVFTGQEHDGNTGLVYFGARYYDPDTARFITQDSYLGESNVPPSLHRYLYAYSNPTVYIDLHGYEAKDIFFGFVDSATEMAVNTTASFGRYVFGVSNGYTLDEVEKSGGNIVSLNSDGLTSLSEHSWYEKQFVADWRNLDFGTVYVENNIEENIKNVGGLKPAGEFVGNTAGALVTSFDDNKAVRDQAHYDVGKALPAATTMAVTKKAPTGKGFFSKTWNNLKTRITGESRSGGQEYVRLGDLSPAGADINKKIVNNKIPVVDAPPQATPKIPGRVQSRINLSKETIIKSSAGKKLKRGMDYAWRRHGGVDKANKSQFSIKKSELESILQSEQVVKSPVRPSSVSGEFIREVDVGRTVGNYPQNLGGNPTSTITVVTDKYGNVVNTFPGIESPF